MGFKQEKKAQGRIKGKTPVAVLDIGSNSIRMVIYEHHSRALTPLYNEKSACALGQGVAASGLLNFENMQKAFKSMRRFALVIKLMKVEEVYCVATSAVREAKNGGEFANQIEQITGVRVQILSGEDEAYFAALGAYAGIVNCNEQNLIVGDLGGGSLELASLENDDVSACKSFELGVIRLAEKSGYCLKTATNLARETIKPYLSNFAKADAFCAIGGSWRALAKLHQMQNEYPLHMIQNYEVDAKNMIEFCLDIIKQYIASNSFFGWESVNNNRRELLPFGAIVLVQILIDGNFESVVFSTLGVREGYLYSLLDKKEQQIDPLIQLCQELAILRSRSPTHANELIDFTQNFFDRYYKKETKHQIRLRKSACLLADIAWRGHPDYRGSQAVDLVAYGALVGINHADRVFISYVLMTRYMGLKHNDIDGELLLLCGQEMIEKAKLLGALLRVAFPLSASMSGVLPQINFLIKEEELQLILPPELAFLDGSRLKSRLSQLAKIANFTSHLVVVE